MRFAVDLRRGAARVEYERRGAALAVLRVFLR